MFVMSLNFAHRRVSFCYVISRYGQFLEEGKLLEVNSVDFQYGFVLLEESFGFNCWICRTGGGFGFGL